MKAICPHCGSNSCDKCEDGYINVNLADIAMGHYHFYICLDCGEENGGLLHYADRPVPAKSPRAVCPYCGSANLRVSTCEESMES